MNDNPIRHRLGENRLVGMWKTECVECKQELVVAYRRYHLHAHDWIIEEVWCRNCFATIPGHLKTTTLVPKRAN